MDYAALTPNEKTAPKELLKMLKRAGAEIAQSAVLKAKRQNSISYKPVVLIFADSQTVELRVKESGDIYQVLLNGKIAAIKNQDDEKKAAAEIVKLVEGNKDKFQKALARKKVKLPTGVKSTSKRKEEALTEEIVRLDGLIAEAEQRLAA